MRYPFLHCTEVALKIWLLSILANTLMGCCVFMDFSFDLIITGLLYSAIFSFPVFVALVLVIIACVRQQFSGEWIFYLVSLCGMILSIGMVQLFGTIMRLGASLTFSKIAILSAIISIALNCKSLYKLGTRKTIHHE